jgi:hypothetical protein
MSMSDRLVSSDHFKTLHGISCLEYAKLLKQLGDSCHQWIMESLTRGTSDVEGWLSADFVVDQ